MRVAKNNNNNNNDDDIIQVATSYTGMLKPERKKEHKRSSQSKINTHTQTSNTDPGSHAGDISILLLHLGRGFKMAQRSFMGFNLDSSQIPAG